MKKCIHDISNSLAHEYYDDTDSTSSCLTNEYQTDKLCLPAKLQDVKNIIKTLVTISVSSYKTIKNTSGKRVVVNAVKHIEIFYMPMYSEKDTYSVLFSIPFTLKIPIDNVTKRLDKIEISTEEIKSHRISGKLIDVSMIVSARALFESEYSEVNLERAQSWDDYKSPRKEPRFSIGNSSNHAVKRGSAIVDRGETCCNNDRQKIDNSMLFLIALFLLAAAVLSGCQECSRCEKSECSTKKHDHRHHH